MYASSVSALTVSRIRKYYNSTDAKAIARQLSVPVKENATPARLLHNAASHLHGPARTLGAVLIGYQGVRAFHPRPVVRVLEQVNCAAVLLALVAMASDADELYAAMKALVGAARQNAAVSAELEEVRGYQVLGMLLRRARHLLNQHVLQLTLTLVGTADGGGREAPNRAALEDLLCDLELWRPSETLLRSMLEHLCELVAGDGANLKTLLRLEVPKRVLFLLRDPNLNADCLTAADTLLRHLLSGVPNPEDLLR